VGYGVLLIGERLKAQLEPANPKNISRFMTQSLGLQGKQAVSKRCCLLYARVRVTRGQQSLGAFEFFSSSCFTDGMSLGY